MSQTSKIVFAVVITAVIVGGLVYWWQNAATTKEPSVDISTKQRQQEESSIQYQNDRLKLKFSYPRAWGAITEKDELPRIGQITLRLSGDIFLAADNSYHEGGRGSYWGDYGTFLKNQASITNLCNKPFASPERVKSCSILQNANGISYAKTQEEICTEGGCDGIATSYYLYNPNSEFKGIVISSDRLRHNNIPQLEMNLDELVKSISFVK